MTPFAKTLHKDSHVRRYEIRRDVNGWRVVEQEDSRVIRDAIYHDSFAFTLRKMHDVGFTHEGILVFEVPGVKDTIRIGAVARYYRGVGTGLERLETVGLLYYRPGSPWIGESGTPFFAGQFGTNPIDPMYQWAFNWVLVAGIDFRLF